MNLSASRILKLLRVTLYVCRALQNVRSLAHSQLEQMDEHKSEREHALFTFFITSSVKKLVIFSAAKTYKSNTGLLIVSNVKTFHNPFLPSIVKSFF